MKINNHILKSFATGDGSLTIEAMSLNDDDNDLIDDKKLSIMAKQYINARWTHERDWFFCSSFNNSVKFVINVQPIEDGSVNIRGRNYQLYVKHNKTNKISMDDFIVTHKGLLVKFAEIINPILFYLNNKEYFCDS